MVTIQYVISLKKYDKNDIAIECKILIQTYTYIRKHTKYIHNKHENNLLYTFDIVYVQPHKQDY